jgi:hypothetical protein
MDKDYKIKHSLYLDLHTGFVKAATQIIETDDRYKGRFIPWKAAVPAGGKVNMEAYQNQLSTGIAETSEDIAEFTRWKAEQAAKKIEQPAQADSSVVGHKESTLLDAKANVSGAAESKPADGSDRIAKAVAAISGLTKADFTKGSGLPALSTLAEKCGLIDLQGIEREQAWEEFKKQNPDWTPKESE